MNKTNKELRDKILCSINLVVSRLIDHKIQSDGELVYSKEGKVITIKARELEIITVIQQKNR